MLTNESENSLQHRIRSALLLCLTCQKASFECGVIMILIDICSKSWLKCNEKNISKLKPFLLFVCGYEVLSYTVYKRRHKGIPQTNYPDRNRTAQCKKGLAEGQPSGASRGADHQNDLGAPEEPKFLGLALQTARILEEQSGVTRWLCLKKFSQGKNHPKAFPFHTIVINLVNWNHVGDILPIKALWTTPTFPLRLLLM